MIIGLDSKVELGTILVGTYYKTHTEMYPDSRVYIIREATLQEWLDYRGSLGLPTNFANFQYGHFYEVSTD